MDRRSFIKTAVAAGGASLFVTSHGYTLGSEQNRNKQKRRIGVYNEWGRLKEAVVGIVDDTVEMDYIPAMKWLRESDVEDLKKSAGGKTRDVWPKSSRFSRNKSSGT